MTSDVLMRKEDVPGTLAKVEKYLEAIDADETINAFITVDHDGARKTAKQLESGHKKYPLNGAIIAIKDNIHVAGLPNTAGTRALEAFKPQKSAGLINRIIEAGGIIIGKTGLHELAYGITSNNGSFGPVRNPVDPTKIPGGSSGGSAAAVAAGFADIAIGTDTGASVRLPAALTGTIGFRPTVGRYPSDGITLISPTRDTAGIIGKSVSDIIVLDSVITGANEIRSTKLLSELRIGVPRAYFLENLDPDVKSTFQRFIAKLEACGATLVFADVDQVPELNQQVSMPVVLFETSQTLPKYLEHYNTGISLDTLLAKVTSPDVKQILDVIFSGEVTEEAYRAAMDDTRPALQAAYARYFERHHVDVIAFPTSSITARNIENIEAGVMVNGELKETFPTYIQNTDPGSNAGIPGISLPIGRSSAGLPIGVELDAAMGADFDLLQIALALEEAEVVTICDQS